MSSHWDEYWQQGHLTSFGDSFKGNYSGVLSTLWNTEFAKLKPNFKVLDVATGNGALPLLINQFFRDQQIGGHVDGVDLAQIATDLSTQQLNDEVTVSLISNINGNELPFEKGQYDLVMSQFGIEYSDLSRSIPEALRVLKTGGRFCVVTHHSRSMIINRNRDILALINDSAVDNVFSIITALVKRMGNMSNGDDLKRVKIDPEAERLRGELNTEISTLAKLNEAALKDCELLNYVATLFQQGLFWSVDKKLTYIEFASGQIASLKERLGELVNAALSEQKVADILASLSDAALECIDTICDDEGKILAWKITLIKLSESSC